MSHVQHARHNLKRGRQTADDFAIQLDPNFVVLFCGTGGDEFREREGITGPLQDVDGNARFWRKP